ncbi:DUF4190 domain-containing protein [Bacillus sp. JJ722]|uniref:DUF4190 domain-containing protein n=1 Tax=Bacillus sp. JJ722 TaxID=3122973 RepID=UPI002FFEA832
MENRETQNHNEKHHEEINVEVEHHQTILDEKVYPEVKKRKLAIRIIGYTALILAVLSLFFSPYLFGTIAVVLGLFALRKGEIGFGAWAIVIGTLSMIISLFLIPIL